MTKKKQDWKLIKNVWVAAAPVASGIWQRKEGGYLVRARRTFNDLARAANVADIVTRSISGHLTPGMQEHYSTVQGSEQRAGIARVISLFGGNAATEGGGHAAPKAPGGEQSTGGGEHSNKAS